MTYPSLRSVVLDAVDARGLAEFYRQLLGFEYRPGDEPGSESDFLMLLDSAGRSRLAFQAVAQLTAPTWPDPLVPQQLHLDFCVDDLEQMQVQRDRALALGAVLLADLFDDPEEPLYVFADPAGHPFCIFVKADEYTQP